MATYQINAVELQSMVNDTTTALPAWDLQSGVTGEVTYGEYMRLRVQFDKTSGGNFAVGQRFVFNPALFVDAPFVAPLQLGRGWVVDIVNYTGSGVFSVYMQASNPQALITQRNTKLVATRISNTRLQLDLFFYAVQDIFGYISDAPRNNAQTLLSASNGVPNLNNAPNSAYRRAVSYLEFLIYAGDANFLPIGIGDPYVRNPAAPSEKSCAYDIGARYIDNSIGATITWNSATTLSENALNDFSNDVGGYKFSEFTRKPNPFLSDSTDENFDVLSFDGQEAILAKDSANLITIEINKKAGFTPSKVVARLWRTDALNSTQQFVTEYGLRTADLPAANATPYPNTIGTEAVFSTPASWAAAATVVNVSFYLNGGQLVSDGEYRVWIGMYDNATGRASSHLSRPMRVATDGRAAVAPLSVSGLIRSFEYQYTGNDVRLSMFQRFAAGINLNAATYTGGASAFASQLRSVAMQYVDTSNNAVIASAFLDFVSGQSISEPEITQTVVGANYFYNVELRVPYTGVPAPANTEVRWVVTFETPNANGSTNQVSITPGQIIRRKAMDIAEIDSLRLLDYAEYQLSNLVYVDTLCRDTDKYIVEVRINNQPPEKNITAILIYENPDGSNTVLEENGFTPTYLPLQRADVFELVPPDFAGNTSAFFVLDISTIPSRAQSVAFGVVLQEI